MQRQPHLGAGHTHNIIIVNPNGLSQLPGCQVNQAPGRAGAHQHHPAPVGASSSHQHPDPGIRTTLLHQEQSQQVRRSLPIRQSNRPMATSVLHHHPLPSTAQGSLMQAVDYFYDLGQVNSLDQPSSRMEVPQYSNPMPFTLQNITTQVPQTPDFHFSLYVLLSPHEHGIHFQQSPVTLYEGSQTFYTTLPIQVRNASYTPRPSTSSGSQPIQPQTSTPSQGSANAHCASLHQVQQCDCKQKQQWQGQEVQIMQGFQPEVMQALSKQQHHNSVPMNHDPDINSESKTPGSNSNTDPDLNSTLCNGNQGNCKRHCVSLSLAQSSSQELKSSCLKSDSVHSIDQNEEYEKRLMMLTFEDAVMMFDFELFDNPKLTGQITEQDQYLQMQNKMRNENNQSKRTLEGHLSKERKSGSLELEAEHCPSIKLTLTRKSLSSFCAEAPCIPHRFTNDDSFYDLKPEQVNLQTLLELEDASDDESCWESLGCKSEAAEQDSSAGVETLPKTDCVTNRKRKRQFLDLES